MEAAGSIVGDNDRNGKIFRQTSVRTFIHSNFQRAMPTLSASCCSLAQPTIKCNMGGQDGYIGTTPYEFWDRETSDYTATYVLSKQGYKDKEVTIKKDVLYVHRIIVPPIIGLPWLYGYNPSYFYELEKSGEQIAKQTSFGTPQPKNSDSSEYSQRLRKLRDLRDEGLITDDEYEQRRKEIVEGI